MTDNELDILKINTAARAMGAELRAVREPEHGGGAGEDHREAVCAAGEGREEAEEDQACLG